ncbi:MAG: two-component sensor histidine kinase [Alphaproteobacteria bacterium]|nr:two-component sensor histidine kinase [Alphaproteobacteria bacterium]
MRDRPLPLPGLLLAAICCIVTMIMGVAPLLAATVFLIWAGTLWLRVGSPPPPNEKIEPSALTTDRMGELFESADTPLLVTRRNRVVIANRAARELFGAHILEQDIRISLRNPDAVQLIDSDESGSVTVRGLTSVRDIWRINTKQLDGGMGVYEFINKTAEADISRAHTDFVANASHELRTPLASIIGYVETLQDDETALDREISRKFLDTISREAQRLQQLVSDLMSLSRIEAEKHDRPTEIVDLGPLVARAAAEGAGPDRADRLDLAIEGEFTILGDVAQLEQLVRNLVDNALKYGDPAQPVTVRVHPSGKRRVRLVVRDRGDGIAPEHIPHLTRRFYRTDPGRSRASGGTGLGLAIVKHIVERHMAKLDIASELGQGTSVTIRFPIERSEKNED